jgi:hypothetical protein
VAPPPAVSRRRYGCQDLSLTARNLGYGLRWGLRFGASKQWSRASGRRGCRGGGRWGRDSPKSGRMCGAGDGRGKGIVKRRWEGSGRCCVWARKFSEVCWAQTFVFQTFVSPSWAQIQNRLAKYCAGPEICWSTLHRNKLATGFISIDCMDSFWFTYSYVILDLVQVHLYSYTWILIDTTVAITYVCTRRSDRLHLV